MDLTKIKVEELPPAVVEWCESNANNTRFTYAAWLEYMHGEVVERIFATRRYSKKGVKIREILRHATGSSPAVVRDLIRCVFGYSTVFERKDVYYRQCGYGIKVFDKEDFGKWYTADSGIGVSYVYINAEMVFTIPEFKYCGFSGGGIINYLNTYRKDHSIEFFGKMGISLSPILMKKAKKDGRFRRFLWENHNAIALYGVQAALFAFKNNVSVEEARRACYVQNQLNRTVAHRIPEVIGTKLDRQRVLDYVDFNDINYASYDDYLKCCKYLKLDLNDTKVVYPNDFPRMHDLRTAQYKSEQAKKDRRKRAKLYREFRAKANEYRELECANECYTIICPMDVSELIVEGESLHHCVGKMGYDKKVADGISIIMFLRKNSDPHTPFVTIEYRIDRKCLSQCYGHRDSKPTEDVVAFAEKWASEVTNKLYSKRAI